MLRLPLACATLLMLTGGTASAADGVGIPSVVASIKPVHALASLVMGELGAPRLLVEGAGSPHHYALKPSSAAALEAADVIFWIGPELEAFLAKPLASIGAKAMHVALIDSPELHRLELRTGDDFEGHAHDHANDDHGEHGHNEHGHDDHDDDDHDAGGLRGELDPHIWLDPRNAQAMVTHIAHMLGEADPANALVYADNARNAALRLGELEAEIRAVLEPVQALDYVVFHDAYRYFETRFGLSPAGSITINPEVKPGAERLGEVRDKLVGLEAACVFAEPQFDPGLVAVVTEGTPARAGILDPLGAGLDDGAELYFELMREMARAMRDCLG